MNHHDIRLIDIGQKEGYAKAVKEIVAWLLSDGSRIDYEESGSAEFFGWWAADKIEAEFGADNGQRHKD